MASSREIPKSPSLVSLGILCNIQGDYEQAEIYFGEAASICREINLPNDFASFYLGCANLRHGDYIAAKIHFIEFIIINRKQGTYNQVGEGLLGLAAVAAGLKHYELAARLVGAGQAIHDAIGWVMKPTDRIEIDPLLQIAREQLGEAKFDDLQTEGRAMTMEQAVSYALEN